MIRQVCWFVTRACNRKCNYCKVFQNRRPKQLNTQESFKLLDIVKSLDPEILIFFGGEPTLRLDFHDLVRYANGLDIDYAIITNGTRPIDFSICKNITCSVDIIPGIHFDGLGDIDLKSHAGYNTLIKAKAAGVEDVCGNMIIHKQSYRYIPDLIKDLSKKGIWSIVGYVHSGSWNKWEFRTNCPEMMLNEKEIDWISKELLKLKDNPNIMLHNVREYFELLPKYYKYSWRCSKFEYLTIDTDGSIMTCPDYRGEKVPKHNIFKFDLDELENDWRQDVKDCQKEHGCAYNHMFQLAYSKRDEEMLVHK